MKKIVFGILAMLLACCLCAGALGESMTALDAFNALMADDDETVNALKSAEAWLDEIMAGAFGGEAADPEALAACLEPMSRITGKDIAAYASTRGLKVAQVRNAYYKALANALGAEIAVHPAVEEKYRNIQLILALFLETDPDERAAASKAEVRAQMTPAYSRRLAEQSALPEQFVEFVIMDENWNDDSWENDEAWRAAANWSGRAEDGFDDITIGSRDADGSTRIADLQEQLISLGYLRGKADGVFGPRTQSALLEFQLANGLAASGAYTAADYDRLTASNAVARWDYGDDFWDSDDLDSYRTPDSPDVNTPDTYDTPGGKGISGKKKDTPDTPDTPGKSGSKKDSPNTPDTPRKSTSKKSASKKSSSRKDSPDSPDTD